METTNKKCTNPTCFCDGSCHGEEKSNLIYSTQTVLETTNKSAEAINFIKELNSETGDTWKEDDVLAVYLTEFSASENAKLIEEIETKLKKIETLIGTNKRLRTALTTKTDRIEFLEGKKLVENFPLQKLIKEQQAEIKRLREVLESTLKMDLTASGVAEQFRLINDSLTPKK